jgi:hypothetical protein
VLGLIAVSMMKEVPLRTQSGVEARNADAAAAAPPAPATAPTPAP